MFADMALDGGLALLRRGVSFIGAKKEADAKKAIQNYKNTMVALAGASNQNIITTNENLIRSRDADTAFDITRTEYITEAKAEVQAAATGTGGRSVNATLFDVERNAEVAQARRRQDLEAQYMNLDAQRESSAFQTSLQIDRSYIPEPSGAAFALGLSTDAMSIYKKYNPSPRG